MRGYGMALPLPMLFTVSTFCRPETAGVAELLNKCSFDATRHAFAGSLL